MPQLKQQITASNMAAITPLKKTPPHFVCVAEELANLSPPKPPKATSLTQTSLSSQSSQGFHPLYSQQHTEEKRSQDSNSSASSSESGGEVSGDSHPQTAPSSIGQHSSNQALGSLQRQHFAALLQQPTNSQPHKKKRKAKNPDLLTSKKHKSSDNLIGNGSKLSDSREAPVTHFSTFQEATSSKAAVSSLLVSIPLADVKIGKPKATVEPYNVRSTTSNRRNTLDGLAEAEEMQGRDRYSRLGVQGEEYTAGLISLHDYHMGTGGGPGGRGERSRGHSHGRWERDGSRDHRIYGAPSRSSGRGVSSDYGGRSHGHSWERDGHYRSTGPTEEYWPDTSHYDSSRLEPQRGVGRTYPRKMDPEYFMLEARRRKKEADKIVVRRVVDAKIIDPLTGTLQCRCLV